MNKRAYAALRRLTVVVYFPFCVLVMMFFLPTAMPIWIITGMDIEDQMSWLEDKNDTYWEWVRQ